jgi:HD-GYP domain-containing protein (c-di-GMP phosphodiesterase class II)
LPDDAAYEALRRYTRALSVALGFRDLHTRLHSERVLGICERIGERAELTAVERGALRIAATFHDVGKIGIPDRILLKPGRLDADEARVMQKHAELGASIVLATELDGAAAVALVVRHHHEHFDGTGYPDGLAGEQIPVCARIVGIADSYDAMAQERSYHPAKGHAEIMGILREETGRKHDPRLMRIFAEVIDDSSHRSALA